MPESHQRSRIFDRVYELAKPVAKRVLYNAVSPSPQSRWLYSGMFQIDFFGREVYEWLRRSLVATPVFLSQCAEHGDDIVVERLPYITDPCRILLGNQIRFAGKVNILVGAKAATLKMGNGVFVGHGTTFAIGQLIDIGDFVGIGEGCYIADTEGHRHYAPNRPIWEVPPGEADIAPVIIEENAQISQDVTILKGVRIGARAVIGAGSVVRSNIPPDAVVMGNPARVVKRMTPTDAPR